MSGSIDEYRFEDVTKDTLYVMRDVRNCSSSFIILF